MSIDYAVHLSHFYNEARGTRREKTTEAIHGVGLSVIGGAITTMGAGAPQFACVILFFRLNGCFIFLTSALSILFSFTMLLPLLFSFGPVGTQGSLAALCRRLCRCGRRGQPRPPRDPPVRV